jgi:hypothetical protein
MLLKLLTLILVIYLVVKFSRHVMKTLFYMVFNEPQKVQRERKKRPADGNVDIDYVPNDYNSSKAGSGDYVDYEEVK